MNANSVTLQNCPPVRAVIPGSLGNARVSAFENSSKFTTLDIITTYAVGKNANLFYKLDLDIFLALLGRFNLAKYNGIRVYFACYSDKPLGSERRIVPTDMEGQLTLLFVPTKKGAGLSTGIDDPNEFWHFGSDNQLTHLPAPGSVIPEEDFVNNWIANYREKRMVYLEQDGVRVTKNDHFQETRSHWYDMKTIAGDNTTNDIGLLSFIRCARIPSATNPITELYIRFAAFVNSEGKNFPEYQLTLIFHLRQATDPPPTKGDVGLTENAIIIGSIPLFIGVIPADTGIPCPPATNCPGSSIPPNL
jgi:hypothetical protein